MAGRNLQSASSTGAAVAGVILCGGGSRRMQSGEKPLLVAGEKSLLQLVIDQVAPQVRQVVLSCGTNTSHYGAIGLPVITDQRNDAGPLAGVEAALADVEGDLLFFCPGDAPRFPANMVSELLTAIGDGEVAFARVGGADHQLFLLVRRTQSAAISAWLDNGGRSVSGWLAHVNAVPVDFANPLDFSNINTPADLESFRREVLDALRER